MIGFLLILLLRIYCRVWRWKNFENRLAFRRVTGKNKVAPFFPDTVYIASESNQVCLWLPYVLNTTKSRLFFPILLRAVWQWAWCDDVCSAVYRYCFCVLMCSVCCRRWKAKDVLLAFWLAALRLMNQSQEILLGHSVLCY